LSNIAMGCNSREREVINISDKPKDAEKPRLVPILDHALNESYLKETARLTEQVDNDPPPPPKKP